MQDLIGLSVGLQLVLVAGYLAYKVTTVGKGNGDRTEDFLLKVLAFGLLARLLTENLGTLAKATIPASWSTAIASLQGEGLATVLVAVALAVIWRKTGSATVSKLMGLGRVYRDDHETSTWLSLTNAKAVWNHVQVHLDNGVILESAFHKTPANVPSPRLVMNDDGILIYVTTVIRENGEVVTGDDFADEIYSTATFIPRGKISQVDIGWKSEA